MDKQEFLLLIPAIIFGVAVVDLLKIFSHKKTYFELMGWGIFSLIAIVKLWIELYDKLAFVTSDNFMFIIIIIQAMLYARSANLITPEEKDVNTKEFFFSIYKQFFYLGAAIATLNILLRYFIYDDQQVIWLRPLVVVFALLCAWVNRVWLRTSILVISLIIGTLVLVFDAI